MYVKNNVLFFILFLITFSVVAQQETIVVLPVKGNVPEEDKNTYRITLQEGLSQRYKVLSGLDVDINLIKHIVIKDCDEKACLQQMGDAFKTKYIALGVVQKKGNGYLLSLEIKDVFNDRVIESYTEACRNCDEYDVMSNLKYIAAEGRGLSQKPPKKSAALSAPSVTSDEAEKETWDYINDSNVIEDYEYFLDLYPKSKYRNLAQLKLRRLRKDQKSGRLPSNASHQLTKVPQLNLVSIPAGASWFLDGQSMGRTPQIYTFKKAGIHRIEVVYDGYQVWKQTIQVIAGKVKYLNVRLEKTTGYEENQILYQPDAKLPQGSKKEKKKAVSWAEWGALGVVATVVIYVIINNSGDKDKNNNKDNSSDSSDDSVGEYVVTW